MKTKEQWKEEAHLLANPAMWEIDIEFIAAIQSDAQPQWLPMDHPDLPKDGRKVLMHNASGDVFTGRFNHDWYDDADCIRRPKGWMPLPKA